LKPSVAGERFESTLGIETDHGIDGIEPDGSVWLKAREKVITSSIPEFSSKTLATVLGFDDEKSHKTE
jgi:hypothetical protein